MSKIEDMSLDELSQVLIECQKALAELKESKKEGKWKPKLHDKYWFRDMNGLTDWFEWFENEVDVWRYNNLPIFKTKEECERYWHFMDTVKEKSYEFSKEEWKNDELFKFWIDRDCTTDTFHVARAFVGKGIGTVYFKSPEDAQYIIDNFKDELMEFFL